MPNRLIVNVRGCNASGKTTLARRFLEHKTDEHVLGKFELKEIVVNECDVPGLELPVMVMGPYDGRKYSGCDAIKSMTALSEAVMVFAAASKTTPFGHAHLLFEGFYVSKSYNRYVDVCKHINREGNASFVWASLRVSLDTILKRIKERAPDRVINLKEITSVVSGQDNQRRNAKFIVTPSPVVELDGERTPEEVYQQLVSAMVERENV